jgi:DNA-binding NarL/FixJ family response regulator/EAL domain-containing protein (putative c-di-GMP-specific phosphodiesterase class I)
MDPIRVLVVDDEESVVDVLRSLIGSDPALRMVGAAHDAEAGIALAVEERPDVVLMDVRMPGGGGLRAVREITKRYPEANVVALSAHEDEDTRIRMIGAGARDYVPKSESTDAILEAIHRSVRRGKSDGHRRPRAHRLRASDQRREEQRARVERALESGCVTASFQPIFDLETGEVAGVEAQPHVAMLPSRPFDAWAGEAEAVDLLAKLELAALRAALTALPALPEPLFLEVEVSPSTVRSARFQRAIREAWAGRLVLAVSELSIPSADLATSLEPLRARGVRLTLADVGAGIGGLEQLVALWPEFVRLDRGISDDIHLDGARHAIVAAVVGATKGGAQVLAEGVTSLSQLDELGRLGVRLVQGDRLAPARHLTDLMTQGLPSWSSTGDDGSVDEDAAADHAGG